MYSSARARAGLVAVIFALIISLVSAVPIPICTTPHSDLIQSDTAIIKGTISTLPSTTITRFQTGENTSVDEDNQLVRRNARINAKIRTGFKKMGAGIKHAIKKVGTFLKHTGAVIVKFGMKVVSTIATIASKAIGLIPGVGKIVGKAVGAVAKLTNFVSDKIHAHIGSKLTKGMSVLNKVGKGAGYIPL